MATVVKSPDLPTRLRDAYAARVRLDYSAFLALIAPDIRFRLLGRPDLLPFSGPRLGADEMLAALGAIDELLEIRELEVEDMIVEGDRVAVRWSAIVANRRGGAVSGVEAFDHIVLRDGLIASFTEFFDTATVAELIARRDG